MWLGVCMVYGSGSLTVFVVIGKMCLPHRNEKLALLLLDSVFVSLPLGSARSNDASVCGVPFLSSRALLEFG